MNEEWRDIEGFEGQYQVSSLGRVKSLGRKIKNGRTLSDAVMMLHWHTNSYWVVWLRRPNRFHRKYFVHRLVAHAFCENPNSLPIVNHIDRDRRNNVAPNLEWCSFKENTAHWMKDDKKKQQIPSDSPIDPADIPF